MDMDLPSKCDRKGHEYKDFWDEKYNYWDWRCKRCGKHECKHDYECCKNNGVIKYWFELECSNCRKVCTKHKNMGFCIELPTEKGSFYEWCEHPDENFKDGHCDTCYTSFGLHSFVNGVCQWCEEKEVCKHKRGHDLYPGCNCKYCYENLCDFTEDPDECGTCGERSKCRCCKDYMWTLRCDNCGETMCDECTHNWEWNENWCKICYEEKVDQW